MSSRELKAPKKKYFKLEYETVLMVLDNLNPEEVGEWFLKIAKYELFGDIPEDFSERAVQMAYKQTVRELDYQMAKHERNRENGTTNYYKGNSPKLINAENVPTILNDVLTKEDWNALEKEYTCADMLVETVQNQINSNHTTVSYPRRYIEAYAAETNWNEKIEAEIDDVSGVKQCIATHSNS